MTGAAEQDALVLERLEHERVRVSLERRLVRDEELDVEVAQALRQLRRRADHDAHPQLRMERDEAADLDDRAAGRHRGSEPGRERTRVALAQALRLVREVVEAGEQGPRALEQRRAGRRRHGALRQAVEEPQPEQALDLVVLRESAGCVRPSASAARVTLP